MMSAYLPRDVDTIALLRALLANVKLCCGLERHGTTDTSTADPPLHVIATRQESK